MGTAKIAGVTASALQRIGQLESPADRIFEALRLNLFPFAALLAMRSRSLAGTRSIGRIVHGLTLYDARLTPVNVKALCALHQAFPQDVHLSRYHKMRLVHTLLEYGDSNLIYSGIGLLLRTGNRVPASSILELLRFAQSTNAVSLAERLYRYMKLAYPLNMHEHTACVVTMMSIFANSDKHHDLCRELASACLVNSYNPSIALGIARAAYKLDDTQLSRRLQAQLSATGVPGGVEFVLGNCREPTNATTAVTAANILPDSAPRPSDAASQVKKVAAHSTASAEQLVEAMPCASARTLGLIALCNQYIENSDKENYMRTFALLNELKQNQGVVLNLLLKWELKHGDFPTAKRFYQNWKHVPRKQRAIALSALGVMADCDREWIAVEAKRLGRQRDGKPR